MKDNGAMGAKERTDRPDSSVAAKDRARTGRELRSFPCVKAYEVMLSEADGNARVSALLFKAMVGGRMDRLLGLAWLDQVDELPSYRSTALFSNEEPTELDRAVGNALSLEKDSASESSSVGTVLVVLSAPCLVPRDLEMDVKRGLMSQSDSASSTVPPSCERAILSEVLTAVAVDETSASALRSDTETHSNATGEHLKSSMSVERPEAIDERERLMFESTYSIHIGNPRHKDGIRSSL